MRPIIGVMPLVDEDKDSLWMLPGYLNGVLEAGGIPVIFPLINDVDIIRQMFSST
jgi:putative glutamine amidotransferase